MGGVVAEVNGTPIYANRIIGAISTALAANAAELDPQRYRAAALDLIRKQIQVAMSEIAVPAVPA